MTKTNLSNHRLLLSQLIVYYCIGELKKVKNSRDIVNVLGLKTVFHSFGSLKNIIMTLDKDTVMVLERN